MLRKYTIPKTAKHLMPSKFYSWKRTVFIFYVSLFIMTVFSTTIDKPEATVLIFPPNGFKMSLTPQQLLSHSKIEGMYCFNRKYEEKPEFAKFMKKAFKGFDDPEKAFPNSYTTSSDCLYLNEFKIFKNSLRGKSEDRSEWYVVEIEDIYGTHDLMQPMLLQKDGCYKANEDLEDTSTTSITKLDLKIDDPVCFTSFEYERDAENKDQLRVFGNALDHRYLIKTFETGKKPMIKIKQRKNALSYNFWAGFLEIERNNLEKHYKEFLNKKSEDISTFNNKINELQDTILDLENKSASHKKTLSDDVKKSASDLEWYKYALIVLFSILLILVGIILYLLLASKADINVNNQQDVNEDTEKNAIKNSNSDQEHEKSNTDEESTLSYDHAVNHEKYYTPINVQTADSINEQEVEENTQETEASTTSKKLTADTAETITSSLLEVSTDESTNITEEKISTEDISQENFSSETMIEECTK